ncbi:protein of unknown function [Bradyrhizobium vignae]|uniref:Uncharacterized protein n=1 Tax=Bradyrhizobium vignae TaxID=1549949 RepID=A0A2U3PYA0_9BRAD|nr:protein of unknown function [Bradyrhizobium vignae]
MSKRRKMLIYQYILAGAKKSSEPFLITL